MGLVYPPGCYAGTNELVRMCRVVLRPGLRAGIVVFDLGRVRDRATNLHPHRYAFENIPQCHPEGLDWVLVNGEPVITEGEHTGALPGHVLRRR